MTLTVPRDIEALILARVEAGDFASAEEVLRDALRPWLEIERARQANLDRIRARIAEGDADAVDLSPDQVRTETRRTGRDRRRPRPRCAMTLSIRSRRWPISKRSSSLSPGDAAIRSTLSQPHDCGSFMKKPCKLLSRPLD